ncbi:hypothetical protein OGAPHI_006633 [Ogataea philodendri]|uniref:Uncharacterized protein n=1 Tax=Ogataea philodendri TaxID=1378263 RepID=A0A9P8NXW3_9ASCO|nr:uncharacterized protein OGAPHI_006633 [Ogataea philodendri]KAH3661226.1 hypothetical protein OGAPHI_006633 [Ogataea philodendri]
MPSVPLLDSHGVSVDVLVQLVEQSNGLDDVIVVLLNRKLNLGSGVGVSKTKLGSFQVSLLKTLEQLGTENTDTSQQILHNFVGVALDVWKNLLDRRSKGLVRNTKSNLVLLGSLWQVQLDHRLQVVGNKSLTDLVGVLKSLGSSLERSKGHKLNKLGKSSQVVTGALDLLESRANLVLLHLHLEDGVSRGLFEKKIVKSGHDE